MKNIKIGLGITGSFCTLQEILPYAEQLAKENTVTPVLSYNVAGTDTRFYKAADFKRDLVGVTGGAVIETIVDAEPVGPKKLFDLFVIAPCTGNTLAKMAAGITDTPVLIGTSKLPLSKVIKLRHYFSIFYVNFICFHSSRCLIIEFQPEWQVM